jgi:ABC-type glycerol-3-phosphate transport system substrate-binding protein
MHTHRGRGRQKLIAATCLLLLALLSLLSGCLKVAPTSETVRISFAHPSSDSDAYQQWVEQFNEIYPYITVELRPQRYDMLGGLNPGTADVYITSQFAMGSLQGNLLDLTPFMEQDDALGLSDFYPGTIGVYMREGKLWAVPAGIDLMVMYYNKDLFDQYAVPYPQAGWTWYDFLHTATELRNPDANVFGYGPNYEMFDPLVFIYQHGGRIFNDLKDPQRTTFDDPRTIEALQWYTRLILDYNVAPTPAQTEAMASQGDIRSAVFQNLIAMWTGMLSERGGGGYRRAQWLMRWGMVPLPRDAQSATLTTVDGYFVSARAQHPDACWKWILFLSKQLPIRQAPARRPGVGDRRPCIDGRRVDALPRARPVRVIHRAVWPGTDDGSERGCHGRRGDDLGATAVPTQIRTPSLLHRTQTA